MRDINEIMPKDLERFFSKIEQTANCWIWTAAKYKNGYGKFWINNLTVLTHRFAYEFFRGEIPKGLTIDHLCRNRACVNPNHLEAVSRKENVLRGISLPAINSRKTHCKNGHSLSDENCYLTPDGRRQCKICNLIRQRNCLNRKLNGDPKN